MSLLDSDDSYSDSSIDGVTIFGRSAGENKAGFQTLNASVGLQTLWNHLHSCTVPQQCA